MTGRAATPPRAPSPPQWLVGHNRDQYGSRARSVGRRTVVEAPAADAVVADTGSAEMEN